MLRRAFHVLGLVALTGCAALPDGVYEVRAVAIDRAELPARRANERILLHDRRFVLGGAERPSEHVLLRTDGFVPLALAEPPREAEHDGRAVLHLTLTPEAGDALRRLTGRAERAAVVIDGEIVTVHRIRVPIEGGLLQVSC